MRGSLTSPGGGLTVYGGGLTSSGSGRNMVPCHLQGSTMVV
jgi:hypothetical protein